MLRVMWRVGVASVAGLACAYSFGCALRMRGAASVPSGIPCEDVAECPLSDNPCRLAQCLEGACVHVAAPASQLPTAMQREGDCRMFFCDGEGDITETAFPSDVPPEDANPCTVAACEGVTPAQRSRAAGAACENGGVCNGRGVCGSCLPGAERCAENALATCDEHGAWPAHPALCSAEAPICSMRGSEARCVGVVELAAGRHHACARFADGSVRCWGARGDHLESPGIDGATASELTSLASFALGARHACGVSLDGPAVCWGANDFGQLGSGDFISQDYFVELAGLSDIKEVAVGNDHSCAREQGGAVRCWGRNDHGQLGSGPSTTGKGKPAPPFAPREQPYLVDRADPQPMSRPVAIAGLTDATELGASGGATCVTREGGLLVCFGSPAYDLPDPIEEVTSTPAEKKAWADRVARTSRVPVPVTGLDDASSLACGAEHCCAIRADASAWCWGKGERGALGDGGSVDRFAPVAVAGVADAADVGLGLAFGCVRTRGGEVHCWGANDKGQLGRGSGDAAPLGAAAAKVDGIADADKLVVGEAFACAHTRAGRVFCWGAGAVEPVAGVFETREPSPIVW